MTTSGSGGPPCREIRQLLGVYVVGAIDPAERSAVDEHLGECPSCRDELAGLAALPAMLSRVPVAEVERLSLSGLPEMAEPPAELLNSLLRKVALKRRSRMWRSVAAVAAAALIAAGGAATVAELTSSGASPSARGEQAIGSSPSTDVAAVVDYSAAPWGGTMMRVRVSGIKPGTTCQFWVLSKAGWSRAGSWTVAASYAQPIWYSVSSPVAASSVHSFQITAAGQVLVRIPAS